MYRLLARNLAIAVFIALPTLIGCAMIATWAAPPEWGGPAFAMPVLSSVVGAFSFWYLVLVLPTLFVAFLHQVALSAMPHHWPTLRQRAVIVGSSVAIGLGIAMLYDVHVAFVATCLLPATLVYGGLVTPVGNAR